MGDERQDGRAFGLSERRTEVLKAVARAKNNRQAASALNLSEATVKRHLANVYKKMGVGSRLGAVAAGVRAGLLSATELWETPHDEDGLVRFRCRETGCGREVVLVRESTDPYARGTAPWCHGQEMARVGDPAIAAETRGAKVSKPTSQNSSTKNFESIRNLVYAATTPLLF
jgi:DNA-binding CsgD family transcriptional regulator